MARFVALLGGINVGGHRVTMDRLRAEVAALGYTDVATFTDMAAATGAGIASMCVARPSPRRRAT